jgi:hypothetical protein
MSKSNAAKRKRQQARARANAHPTVSRSTAGNDRDVPAPPSTTADAFDQWLISLWTLRIASVTLALAVCVAVFFAFALNSMERAQQVYDRAQVCTAVSAVNCVDLLDATISGKSETGGKNSQYFLTLAGPVPASGQFAIPMIPVWDGMDVGDNVTATVWNGQVVQITDGAISGNTSMAPSLATAAFVALFVSSVAWVIAFALFAARVLAAARGHAPGWTRALIPVNPAAALSVFVFPVGSLAGNTNGSILTSALAGVGLSAVAGSYFVVNWIRKRPTPPRC